ncbi:MAG: hypothetical protein HYU80_00855 [Candidatus Blackburnbacteria bacterium]|nr:hypothetical protein [Candidatus Blackburnbacteria bacterium]
MALTFWGMLFYLITSWCAQKQKEEYSEKLNKNWKILEIKILTQAHSTRVFSLILGY